MPPNEPRFILIDLHKQDATPLTTDEVQAAFFRLGSIQPKDTAYFGTVTDSKEKEYFPNMDVT